MTGFSPLDTLNVTKRSSPSKFSRPQAQRNLRQKDEDLEKNAYPESSEDDSDDESDYSSSAISSRETSGSYSSNRPMLRRKSLPPPRSPAYRLPNRTIRYLCLALISTLVIFMLSLVRMSIVSSRRVQLGDIGSRPAPRPPTWEKFEFLTRYYGGIRTLTPLAENKPEYPTAEDEIPISNQTSSIPIRDMPASRPFEAYKNHTSKAYLSEYAPVQECFLDEQSKVRVPQLQHYDGRPRGFPDNIMGSYEVLGLPEDICFERYGRFGAYGYGYASKYGGTGTGQHGDMEGSEDAWGNNPRANQVDYSTVDWAAAQKRCYNANAERFDSTSPALKAPMGFFVSELKAKREEVVEEGIVPSNSTIAKKHLPRNAVVIRSWDDFEYREEDILHLRAMISELSLGSGGEYDVHLLIQVKDEPKNPIWADEDTYQKHLNESVPKEFRGIATLWSETQMLMLYQGIFDTFIRDRPVHGPYRGLQMAMQHFAHVHPEYDFFWHWEIDIRYTGHYYNLFSQVSSWAKTQPRKGLWERSSRFYIPSVHGSWEDFVHMVRVQTDMGTESPENIWAGIKGSKGSERKGDKPIWGPQRPHDSNDWFEIERDPKPPTSYEKDKHTWGVGEDADLITFNPLFDPEGTTWLLEKDITGYNSSDGLPPRRAAIVTSSRMSKRLLNTMHRETAFKKHHAFSEMWAATTALHHGYKAVYAPHPVYVDREWPTAYLAGVMNAGRNGATGGSRTSVFGEREHNLLGMSWYYNAGFAPNLWRRWLGFKVNNEGGEEFETTVDEGRDGKGVNGMRGGEGRMCLPPMLIHPVKGVELPVEESREKEEVPESDPSA
ncbi:uncharacterized protein L3040_003348 [Drepanopeziza brunnea f. sp. 'multigermtubi']|uniref:Major facilitator superfamily transporter n=1 Tax=Marssonina brunnea f. sp. multigermtubi (strain MB_m1) TaxID=1072389 RepID=K1WJ15_MARBU|nr:uncharacterized protein MBM_09641 [Drepanopeziza brunnea f. sp. 'multigermtubi' MB_m1]EKD12142.1 hypothetical protein MBM_09641 [Drepanopeziza brunnea f. sp. 'multigermtubi' MB_m1]KAJ5047525.1 hypothetical protein L3040_003348 [Drepanopeziza brunnea f. sp. 'multigermtubi']